MESEDGSTAIVFNGEIYNHRALREKLQKRGHRFRSSSDTEVLLHLYEESGVDMLHELRGMYALAIWDARKGRLFLARDPFGIKPLYYADNGKAIRVASQVKALLAGNAVDTSAEPAGHVGFLLWGSMPEPYTLYRGVRSLPAGTSLLIDRDGNKHFNQFCAIPSELDRAARSGGSPTISQARELLRESLLDTVRHHLVADVPVGVFLSSGLDSTTLAALAEEIAPGTLHTVTLGFREFADTINDEVPAAEEVARLYGAHHRTIYVEKHDFHDEMPRILDAMDQPSTDGVNSYFICRAANQAGLKVVLSGLGGDELFGSYPSFRQIPSLMRKIGPLAGLPSLGKGFRVLAAPLLKHLTSPKFAGLLEYGGSFAGAYLLRRGMFMPWELPGLIDPEMVRDGWRELNTMQRLELTANKAPNAHLKVSALEMCWYMRNQLLRDTDWASMAHSLEVRVPLVDLSVLHGLSPLFALSGGSLKKRDIALTPKVPLPRHIIDREKTGFSVPVRQWLEGDAGGTRLRGLRGWAREVYKNFCQGP